MVGLSEAGISHEPTGKFSSRAVFDGAGRLTGGALMAVAASQGNWVGPINSTLAHFPPSRLGRQRWRQIMGTVPITRSN